jgi:hypothetical protein
VLPFLKSLKNTAWFPIQQVAIVGDADYILCCAGNFVWLELKKDVGLPSVMQQYKADWVKRMGGYAYIARPSNWDKVRAKLKLLDEGIRPYDKN